MSMLIVIVLVTRPVNIVGLNGFVRSIKMCDYQECKHCLDGMKNEIGEVLAFCDLWGEWKNVTLGDCFGNCESQVEIN